MDVRAQVSVSVVEPGVVKTPFHELSHSTVGSRHQTLLTHHMLRYASIKDRPTLAYSCVVSLSTVPLIFAIRAWRW